MILSMPLNSKLMIYAIRLFLQEVLTVSNQIQFSKTKVEFEILRMKVLEVIILSS